MNIRQVTIWTVVLSLFVSGFSAADEQPYLTTSEPLTLFSTNDGEIGAWPHAWPTEVVDDSFTVIKLFQDRPPVSRTVYGKTSSSIMGAPYAAIVGQYAIVTNHDRRPFDPDTPKEVTGANEIAIVDLAHPDYQVVSRFRMSGNPMLALPHPDQGKLIVGGSDGWHVFSGIIRFFA